MGVTLERVQFKFASIIGELCSEPRVLSQFAVWLDLRLAEYKLKGSISLECSNDKPDPTWLEGIKDEKPIVEDDLFLGSMIKKRKLSHRDSISSLNRASPHEFSGHTSDEMLPESSLRVHDRRSHPAAVSDFPVTGFVDELPVNNSMGLQVKSETSSSRRKRLPGSIIRNTNVVEDDVIEDRVGTLQHSFDSPTDLPVFNVQRSSEDPGDKSGMSLSPCQREATSARGEVEQTITEFNDNGFGDTVNPSSRSRRYCRSFLRTTETPEQKKLRMRELAKMRQRRCRERQRMRRLLSSGGAFLMSSQALEMRTDVGRHGAEDQSGYVADVVHEDRLIV